MSRGRARPQLLRVEQIRSKLVFGMPAPWRILPVHGVDVEGQQRVERPRGAPSFEAYGERAVLDTICHGRASIPTQRGCSFPLWVARFSISLCNDGAQGCSRETDAQAAQETRLRTDLMATDKLRSYGAAKAEIGLCGLATSKACASTIGLRIHISRRDRASERLELDWRCI